MGLVKPCGRCYGSRDLVGGDYRLRVGASRSVCWAEGGLGIHGGGLGGRPEDVRCPLAEARARTQGERDARIGWCCANSECPCGGAGGAHDQNDAVAACAGGARTAVAVVRGGALCGAWGCALVAASRRPRARPLAL